ncbi:alpha/beta hydrolase [Streptomyces geranii]|uniref:alpha/beta hydrolase n=1 Tax=Streptomyces geranii TaxID=2058923 RepID=UPI001300AF50|nr:alpha/beta fold hydrolase [Streptomyces geranii]
MKRENHMVGESFVYRFAHPQADHVLLVQHGTGGHGGIYDTFATHYAGLGAEVWCMDAPGHGRSRTTRPAGRFTLEEWVEAAVDVGEYIADETGLPVFVKGSSLGTGAAYGAYAASDLFTGAVLMGFAIPSSPVIPADNPFRTTAYERMVEQFGDALQLDIGRFTDFDTDYGYRGAERQKREDPLNTWTYEFASLGSMMRYDPAVPLADNTKPILFTVGEKDPVFTPEVARSVVAATGGPVELYVHPDGAHQLMLFHTIDYARVVRDWCQKSLRTATLPTS